MSLNPAIAQEVWTIKVLHIKSCWVYGTGTVDVGKREGVYRALLWYRGGEAILLSIVERNFFSSAVERRI